MRSIKVISDIVLALSILGLGLTLLSCEVASVPEQNEVPELSRITPVDSSIGISIDAAITVEFIEGMDIASCQSRFGLFMADLDSIPSNMMGQMHGMVGGEYHWNDEQTMMTFYPDSTFMDSTMYSICLQEGMQMHHHGGGNMMNMNHMGSYGSTVGNGIISKFHTRN
ncbi:MAG: Ig-like domain-containing protein [Candidatus Marinimicrobia bacterium]|nr:Ig-like domain-containing protein [Candidatus Neomarinimicrobiota bacterium]